MYSIRGSLNTECAAPFCIGTGYAVFSLEETADQKRKGKRRMIRRLIDMHCDTISELQKRGAEENIFQNHLCMDMEGMELANTIAQFFACFTDGREYEEGKPVWVAKHRQIGPQAWDRAYQAVLGMIERIHEEENDRLDLVKSSEEIQKNSSKQVISAVATVEEGGVLNGESQRLAELYEKGIRLMTLTWNYENCLGYPNSRDASVMGRGLKQFGLETVEQMNQLGMIVDVSHLSDGGFWDCIRHSRTPIVASHSNARALCDCPRNLTDEMLGALAENGGAAGLNFYPVFLRKKETDVTVQDIARHASHMIRVAGEDVPAIGTDFDGFEAKGVKGYLSGPGEMERVWEAMKKEKITERQIDKIAYENAWRVLKEVL